MANLKEVKERIGSVRNTQKITRAMKLVSASKLKRATDRITEMRPYSDRLFGILQNILANVNVEELNLNFSKEPEEVKKVLVILLTSDKGLCGGFNSNLIKQAKVLVNEKYAHLNANKNITLVTVGKKGYDAFKRDAALNNVTTYIDLFKNLNFEAAADVAEYAMDAFLNGVYDKVHVVYPEFKNAATQIFKAEQFLPISELEVVEGEENNFEADFIFEPEKEELVKELIPKILKTQFYTYLLDTNASEHGARMVAMDKATDNAGALEKELNLIYNRQRQAAITTQILEIVGGAAALED
ncbi:MAG: ATP synthase F1 subunit gamma [Chitinophagales bacterium]